MAIVKKACLNTILFVSDIKVFFAVTFWLMILLVQGTIGQREMGLFEVQDKYFSSWFFNIGPIPVPGGMTTMGLMFLGLLIHLVLKTKKISITTLGSFITHIGAVTLLGGAFITNTASIEGSLILKEGQTADYFELYEQDPNDKRPGISPDTSKRLVLPFSVTLVDFEKKFHPETRIAKSFKSVVVIHDQDLHQERTISMNEPLRYKGYTFYQASFSENSEGETTDLAVVKNEGRLMPYISTILISLGLIIHLIFNMPRKKREER